MPWNGTPGLRSEERSWLRPSLKEAARKSERTIGKDVVIVVQETTLIELRLRRGCRLGHARAGHASLHWSAAPLKGERVLWAVPETGKRIAHIETGHGLSKTFLSLWLVRSYSRACILWITWIPCWGTSILETILVDTFNPDDVVSSDRNDAISILSMPNDR